MFYEKLSMNMKKKRHYVSVVFKEALFGVKTRLLLTPKKPCLQHKEALFANRLNCRCKKILGKGVIFKILYLPLPYVRGWPVAVWQYPYRRFF